MTKAATTKFYEISIDDFDTLIKEHLHIPEKDTITAILKREQVNSNERYVIVTLEKD